MEMIFYKTRNQTLQKYLEGYYFISEDQKSDIIQYKTFPNNYSILSVSLYTDVLFEENKITIIPSETSEIFSGIVFRYTNPIEVIYTKAVDEVTFYFKPLGLNHFLSNSDFFQKQKSLMNFYPFPDFNAKMIEILKLENRELQIETLENYLLSKLQEKDLSLMEKLLSEVESSDLKIDEIAKKFNISRQYLNKLFLRHLGKSPAEYRKIHRFRNALKRNNASKNLTDLSHDNLFYDQSHFNKDFKELTQSNPSSFFKKVDTEKGNIWLFI